MSGSAGPRALGVFSVLAVCIACPGLFGLAAYVVERRTREVGIRKVLGASVPQVLWLLSGAFARLVLVAFLLAAPVAYFGMQRWLDRFAYHAEVEPGLVVGVGMLTLAVALATVGVQAFKAAVRNPVETLRHE